MQRRAEGPWETEPLGPEWRRPRVTVKLPLACRTLSRNRASECVADMSSCRLALEVVLYPECCFLALWKGGGVCAWLGLAFLMSSLAWPAFLYLTLCDTASKLCPSSTLILPNCVCCPWALHRVCGRNYFRPGWPRLVLWVRLILREYLLSATARDWSAFRVTLDPLTESLRLVPGLPAPLWTLPEGSFFPKCLHLLFQQCFLPVETETS